ncbi:GTPase HflX, partial [Staphylococcus haemolyticus]
VIFNKKDQFGDSDDKPLSSTPSIFVSSRDEEDKLKLKALLIDQVKSTLSFSEESVPRTNADRLYFLKQHTLIEDMNFNPE